MPDRAMGFISRGGNFIYSIVCCSNNSQVLYDNLLHSKDIMKHDLQVIKSEDHNNNVKAAYNGSLKLCKNDIVIFVHQDVLLHDNFFTHLDHAVDLLSDCPWAVMGVAGKTSKGTLSANVIDRGRPLVTKDFKPTEVQTLDELILIVNKSLTPAISFDEKIPHHHLFGADLCLQAKRLGKKSYVIDASCSHNSSLYSLPPCYHQSEAYIRLKWSEYLPIHTTCSTIDREGIYT